MGISRAQLDLAGKNAFLADGDLCPLDGGQLNFPEQGGVVADLDAVVVALDAEAGLGTGDPVAQADGVVAAIDIDLAALQGDRSPMIISLSVPPLTTRHFFSMVTPVESFTFPLMELLNGR